MAKRSRARRNKRSNGRVSTTHAPTMNNMQQVGSWTLYDLVPVVIQSSQALLEAPVTLQIEAGTNGWNYLLTQGTLAVGNDAALYGQLTQQFAQLANVWQTFRLDSVMLEFTPSNFAGLGQASPMASIVDAAGLTLPVTSIAPAEDILARFSRSRTLQVNTPYVACRRTVNYHNWLVQTCPEPWLLTKNGLGTDGRQLYPDAVNDQRSPVIRLAAQYVAPTQRQLIGFIRVAAKYQVRGRQLESISTSSILSQMRLANIGVKDLMIEQAHEPQHTGR